MFGVEAVDVVAEDGETYVAIDVVYVVLRLWWLV